ncbi:aspartate aminotransferase family protein [Microbacterium testaceum]|uniref:Aspartate aminotransferase family protein n=1 Tax=Microbacterium testaceum TaxID=2033 RepID=A0A4Y3QQ86_MICTE|nr:pyridoxal-dependent decarboxylase [Microbacterium testaceum]PNW10110.1 aspartate aminotransferase family protein [Microbacterium testaceum]GEB47342.1 aspartate aminotransferase family protein [Microbacterium testaceum]
MLPSRDPHDRPAELAVLADADRRAQDYVAAIGSRPVYPSVHAREALSGFDEELSAAGHDERSTIALLDELGSAAAVESNGARYFGFVVGATLPVAAAADRLVLAWDNTASTPLGSPATSAIEAIAARWVVEVLDLPRDSAVGFSTSAGAGTVAILATARQHVLAQLGWDVARRGLTGAPPVRVVASELAHVVVRKALRVLGFGSDLVEWVRTDEYGRIDPDALPAVDASTIVILQAGEVNTGEFDPFEPIMQKVRASAGWIHVDGAFGLWARASRLRPLTDGIDRADSWTVDGHKWLNTPYDSAVSIVRNRDAANAALHSDATYAPSTDDAQKNLTLEFSRRARGIPIWAALRTLGRDGVAELVENSTATATRIADGLRGAGYTVLNRVVLNQVLARAGSAEETARIVAAAQASGHTWFGATVWRGEPAFRISVSSWRTRAEDADALVELLAGLARA